MHRISKGELFLKAINYHKQSSPAMISYMSKNFEVYKKNKLPRGRKAKSAFFCLTYLNQLGRTTASHEYNGKFFFLRPCLSGRTQGKPNFLSYSYGNACGL